MDEGHGMTTSRPLGPAVDSFFLDHLITVKGLRPASVRSYRDTIRLLLCFVAKDKTKRITKLNIDDLTFERILAFLRYLEHDRANHVRTRNQRLAALHILFEYIATREPETLGICQQVAAIPTKRAAPAETTSWNATRSRPYSNGCPRASATPYEIRHSCCSSTTPAHGSKRSPTCGPDTSTSAKARWSAFTARATSGAPVHCGVRPPHC
jgi:hypothetical protein